MNRGVEILLKRMESTPEEFQGHKNNAGKWAWVVLAVLRRAQSGYPAHTSDLPFLSDDEVRMIYGKWLELQEGWFTEEVLKTLLANYESPTASTTGPLR